MSVIFGENVICRQDDGPDVELVVFGDEFYARHETTDGYTVVFDKTLGLYCYAVLKDGCFASSSIPLTKRPPLDIGRHLHESAEVQAYRFELRHRLIRPPEEFGNADVNFTLGPADGLLEGRRVSAGNVLGLTILVEFSDTRAAVTRDDVNALLNGDNYNRNGNFSSVREYFRLVSNGRLDFQNTVVGPVRLARSKKHYETTSFVEEALQLAVDDHGVDLSQYDSKNQGIADAVSFMYAGRTVYGVNGNNNNPSYLWPHNSVRRIRIGDTRTHFYMMTSLGRRAVDMSIGTFCHENGHMLCRFPDLYDYGRRDQDNIRSMGMGHYCLMGSGNHLNRGRTPAPVCAYLRELVAWVDRVIDLDSPRVHELRHGDYGTIARYPTAKPTEYFLVENRSRRGLDEYLLSDGLAVYHCDREGSNEWQAGTAARHYQCALLQADGRSDLERNRPADRTDLYSAVTGVAISADTIPSSQDWAGRDSGFVIANITEAGEVMRFETGEPEPVGELIAAGRVTEDRLIPDDEPEGITSAIQISEHGTASRIAVSVDIIHTYISDLEVELETPSGEKVMLHGRSGSDGDDIRETFTSQSGPLGEAVGEAIEGAWKLNVRDLTARDVGRLNEWSLEIEYTSGDSIATAEVTPNLVIPDNKSGGVASTLSVAEAGSLKDIGVEVEITHTFIQDLVVELVAPSGHAAVLHNRTGGNADDIRKTYKHSNAPALAHLVGQEIGGAWQLRVKDLEAGDEGTLKHWALRLRY
ncbi:MAG: M6 family metalloprotease domain-containing protein [bacterium]|nr:M6 family metalloprotease domain-containing protein [bacterium]